MIIKDLRGNVPTRIQKLRDGNYDAIILAKAGINRLNIDISDFHLIDLSPMMFIPAPAQGAISVQNLTINPSITKMLKQINHVETEICTNIERSFLNKLEEGCTAPIGAYAKIANKSIVFRAVLLSAEGKNKIEINEVEKLENIEGLGERFAKKIISLGGDKILNSLKG